MERLWKLSLVALLLGGAIDAWSTYLAVQRFGIEIEINPFASWLLGHLGHGSTFVLYSMLSILVWWLFRFLITKVSGSWVGVRLGTFFGFSDGIMSFLAGTRLASTSAAELASLILPRERAFAWASTPSVIWAVSFFYVALFASVWVILVILDKRRQASEH